MAGNGMHQYHPQWPPTPARSPIVIVPPLPPYSLHSPMSLGNRLAGTEEVRVIFISGLPEDITERELQNFLRWLPGFEASQINFKVKVPMGPLETLFSAFGDEGYWFAVYKLFFV
ncbi:hypothetical protein SSX86_008275 [Deinandra increscens subsp. villosa]|uniref:RRM domain-containing protein n=1 Tax=Deinandra increscens subsp. villosa TaxID=3103831 RepID=A0AAP0DAZ3_9ASTR